MCRNLWWYNNIVPAKAMCSVSRYDNVQIDNTNCNSNLELEGPDLIRCSHIMTQTSKNYRVTEVEQHVDTM